MFFFSAAAEAVLQALGLKLVLQPEPLLGIRYVRELGADGIAVDEVERREDVLQLHARRDRRRAAAGDELGVHIGRRQAEVRGVENVRLLARREIERIQVGDQDDRDSR